ncbi:MAG: ABC transporter ATP-binding protein [Armatimonadetes bacterium]|nr:ABC transporter ATP-binding protein [Armatimonadota bacterium]
MATVRVENLTLRYGKFEAVKKASLQVEDGEYCVLLGPSGCGKTSILRMIAGFIRPTEGHVFVNDDDITQVYPGDRNIAMIFQSYALYPHLTVRGNFEFPLKAQKLSKEEIESRVQETAGLMRMTELLDRYPRELSGGQQQRVAVGRAIIRRASVLLLDEPLGNLDAKLRVEMRASLKEIQRNLGVTAIHVTHDQIEAQALADKIVVMEAGSIQQVGSSEQVYERPTNLFVAGFIGTPAMNFFNCQTVKEVPALQGPGFRLAMGDVTHLPDRLTLGIRPEHLEVYPSPAEGLIAASVRLVEPQGNLVIIDLTVGEVPARAMEDKERLGFIPSTGQAVYLGFRPDKIHLFAQDGRALR